MSRAYSTFCPSYEMLFFYRLMILIPRFSCIILYVWLFANNIMSENLPWNNYKVWSTLSARLSKVMLGRRRSILTILTLVVQTAALYCCATWGKSTSRLMSIDDIISPAQLSQSWCILVYKAEIANSTWRGLHSCLKAPSLSDGGNGMQYIHDAICFTLSRTK